MPSARTARCATLTFRRSTASWSKGGACELLFGLPRAFIVARHLLDSVAHTPEIEGGVQYVHLLFDTHEIVVSNGLPSESFQPARRMLELMTGESRDRLNAALEVLGADAMLTRPDALQILSSRKERVFLEAVKPADMAPTPGSRLSAGHHLHGRCRGTGLAIATPGFRAADWSCHTRPRTAFGRDRPAIPVFLFHPLQSPA